LNINACYPLSKMTQALELLRREPFLNVRQQFLNNRFS
jgi:hypothetical protein